MAGSTYKFTYFVSRGLGETVRLIFAYADIPFEDVRIVHADWLPLKKSYGFGVLPVLEVDGIQINQSVAICRFLGKKFCLVEQDPVKEALLEALIDNIRDLKANFKDIELLKTEEAKEKGEEFSKTFFDKVENSIVDGHLYGTKTTNWVEIYFTAFVDMIRSHGRDEFLKDVPKLVALTERVKSKESVKKWIDARPADVSVPASVKAWADTKTSK